MSVARYRTTVLVCAAWIGGCAVVSPPSLYDRLGGEKGMATIVDGAVAAAVADDRITSYFARTNIARFKLLLGDQLCEATGGPCTYTGQEMSAAHRGRHISDAQFDAMLEDFVRSMDSLKVSARERGELLAILAAMRGEIVGQ